MLTELQAIIWLAGQLRLPVEDVATVIAVESSFNPQAIGGQGNQHHGLIQWGAWERRHELPVLMRRLGMDPRRPVTSLSFAEQVQLAQAWLRWRERVKGRPIRTVHDMYALINPGAYRQRGDAWGTRAHVVLGPRSAKRREAQRWLAARGYYGDPWLTPVAARPQTRTTPETPPALLEKHPQRGLVLRARWLPEQNRWQPVVGYTGPQLYEQVWTHPERFVFRDEQQRLHEVAQILHSAT